MARDWSFEEHVAVPAGNFSTTFISGARDTGTTVGGMRVYELPHSSPYEAVTVTVWLPTPRAPFADGVIPQIGWKKC